MHAPNLHLLKKGPAVESPAIAALLQPFHLAAAQSTSAIAGVAGRFRAGGRDYAIPRFIFTGPGSGSGDTPIRLGLFGGIHGDEPESILGLLPFFRDLVADPELARGYVLYFYPIVNPTGVERGTRESLSGRDLNREFWSGSG